MVVDEDESIADDAHAESEMSTLKHSLLTTAIVALGFATAFVVDDLRLGKQMTVRIKHVLTAAAVLSFVGSTGSTTISFILPGLLYWKVRAKVFCVRAYLTGAQLSRGDSSVRWLNRAALGLAIYGICVCVFW